MAEKHPFVNVFLKKGVFFQFQPFFFGHRCVASHVLSDPTPPPPPGGST